MEKIRVPASLKKKPKHVNGRRELNHHDIAAIIHVQKKTGLRRHCRKQPRCIRDDFITMYLVKWPLSDLVRATSLLITIINESNHHFASTTPFTYFIDGREHTLSYRAYYNMLYEEALLKCRDGSASEPDTEEHTINLLRACFVIGFVFDERIRRFVMANHSIHTDYTLTRPPSRENASLFVNECRVHVEAYLRYGDEFDDTNILSTVRLCISIWIRLCMT